MIISKQERKWLWIFCLVVIVLTTIPYFIGFSAQNDQWVYTGFLFGLEDGNSYIAKMLIGQSGFWLFRTPYTIEPQKGFLAFLPYLLLGKLASPPDVHTQLVVLFHVFRWIACLCYIWATYDFLSVFISQPAYRRLGTILAVFGGGLGWLSLLGVSHWWRDGLPLDFYSPETFGFLSILGLPHLAMARALLLWGLARYLRPRAYRNKVLSVLVNDGGWLALGFFQPLTIVVGGVVIGTHLVYQTISFLLLKKHNPNIIIWQNIRHDFWRALWAGFFALPFLIYNFLSFYFDPFLSSWQKQNLILSPPPKDYFLAYGIIAIFSLVGLVSIIRKRLAEEYSLVWLWLMIFPVLAYAPYQLQRRLPEGVWTAWIVLALVGLENIRSKWKMIGYGILSTMLVSAILLLIGGIGAVSTPGLPLFLKRSEVEVFKFLYENAPADSVVLALHSTSNAIPAWAPVRTLVGHGPESIHLAEVLPKVKEFYSNFDRPEEQKQFQRNYHIRYVFCGPEEADYGSCMFDEKVGLNLIIEMNEYKLFEFVEMEDK